MLALETPDTLTTRSTWLPQRACRHESRQPRPPGLQNDVNLLPESSMSSLETRVRAAWCVEVLEGNHGLQKRSPPLSKELAEKVAKLTFLHSVRRSTSPLRDKQIIQVSRLKPFLHDGAELTVPTQTQADCAGVKVEGPFKGGHHDY